MPTRLVLATAWPCRRRRPSLRWRMISSCGLGRAPPRGVRRFAAQSLRAKVWVLWQPLAVVQRQPSARAAFPILQKSIVFVCGSATRDRSRGAFETMFWVRSGNFSTASTGRLLLVPYMSLAQFA